MTTDHHAIAIEINNACHEHDAAVRMNESAAEKYPGDIGDEHLTMAEFHREAGRRLRQFPEAVRLLRRLVEAVDGSLRESVGTAMADAEAFLKGLPHAANEA